MQLKAFVEICISLIKNIIEIIIDKQQEAKIILAKKTLSKYKSKYCKHIK